MSNPTTMSSKSEAFSGQFYEVPAGTDDNTALTPHKQSVVAMSDRPAAWLGDTLLTLNRLRSLEPNWDSYGAKPISDASCNHAKSVLKNLAHVVSVPKPLVSATPDGHVGFCWDEGTWSLDAWIESTGRIMYTYLDETDSANDCEAQTDTWQDLLSLLTQWQPERT